MKLDEFLNLVLNDCIEGRQEQVMEEGKNLAEEKKLYAKDVLRYLEGTARYCEKARAALTMYLEDNRLGDIADAHSLARAAQEQLKNTVPMLGRMHDDRQDNG